MQRASERAGSGGQPACRPRLVSVGWSNPPHGPDSEARQGLPRTTSPPPPPPPPRALASAPASQPCLPHCRQQEDRAPHTLFRDGCRPLVRADASARRCSPWTAAASSRSSIPSSSSRCVTVVSVVDSLVDDLWLGEADAVPHLFRVLWTRLWRFRIWRGNSVSVLVENLRVQNCLLRFLFGMSFPVVPVPLETTIAAK